MRLPRRVPWASASELDQVCAWIYTDEHDLVAKSLAVNRLSAWKNITPLPHALESTLSLLVVLQQDRNATANSLNSLYLRHSYAAAIIRLVNGLVDPLQLGAYARSIASIASQLGLPHWLVELRHAATHEDLPSIEILREAAQQSMSWLLHNYFLPTLNPASTPERKALPLRPLGPILKQYRSVLKTITRDASLRTRYKQDVNTITRDIERWISEANVAANITVGEVGWGIGGKELTVEALEGSRAEDIGPKEKWALEKFCDVLLEKGGLVPLSKRKRIFPEDKFWPPEFSVSLWAPLLNHIRALHADFPSTLCTHILSVLLPDNTTGSPIEAKNDPSYDICLARWVMWSLDNWSTSTSTPRTKEIGLRRDVVSFLMKALGHRTGDPRSKDTKAARVLLEAICLKTPEYTFIDEFLSKPFSQFSSKGWTDHDLETMMGRLAQLLSAKSRKTSNSGVLATPVTRAGGSADVMGIEVEDTLPVGWRRADPTQWNACPIGAFQKS